MSAAVAECLQIACHQRTVKRCLSAVRKHQALFKMSPMLRNSCDETAVCNSDRD